MQAATNESPKSIRLRIASTWAPQHGRIQVWDTSVWKPRYKMIKPTLPLEELLPVCLKHYVHHYAKQDKTLSNQLAKGMHIMMVTCTLRVSGMVLNLAIPLNEDPRVEILGDLTEDRCPSETVTITAHLTLDLHAHRESQRLTIDINNLIHTDSYLESKSEDLLKWCRVGNVKISEKNNVKISEKDSKTVCIKRQARPWECVAYTNPLLASYEPESRKVQLYTLHAYDFIDFVVGDMEERRPWSKLGRSVKLSGFFGDPRWVLTSMRDLAMSITKYFEEGGEDEEEESGTPFLPTFCYNTFHAQNFGLGMETWPSEGIDLAVSCVNRYSQARDMQNLEFPRDIRLSIWENETMENLRKDVSGHINVAELADGVNINSNKLFDPKHEGKWEMEFWVIPQRQRKLFRYTQGKLSQFLDDSSDVRRTWDKRLYCEAHIVPKRN